MVRFLNRFGFWISLIICVAIYLALAYKNPFNDNSLIANLEPYPDTILYSFPAWNWVRGNGWNLGVNEKIVDITVPNTYGVLLVPLMWIFKDIRSFYFTNLIFGIGALVFFMLALNNFFGKEKWYLIGFLGFLLASNFYFFNQPQLVMAENVNYLLISVFLYLLSLKFKWKHLILIFFLILITYILKVSNLVLAGSFLVSFLLKILWEKLRFLNGKKVMIILGSLSVLIMLFYLPKILSLSNIAFNIKFFPKNFEFYFSCLKGNYCRNLWYHQKLVTWDIVGLFIVGLLVMLKKRKDILFIIELLLPIIIMVLALSLFVDTEGRHIEILVPIMLIFGGFAIDQIFLRFKYPILVIFLFLGLNLIFTGYQTNTNEPKIVSLKKQVGLNFRHREDPWNYLCLKMVDNFMKDKKDAYFGSFLPIYFFDAYGVKINYLPLSVDQDFMGGRGLTKYFNPPLTDIYKEKLKENKDIYLSDYYASNGREYWRYQWDQVINLGKLEKVFQSPLDNCNIYKLSNKK